MIQSVPHQAAQPLAKKNHDVETGETDDQETLYRPTSDFTESHSPDELQIVWSMKTPDGSVYGPVNFAELESWAAEGRISSHCLIRQQGKSHWQSALTLFPDLASMQVRQPVQRPPVAPASVGVERVHVQDLNAARAHGGVGVLILSLIGLLMPCFPVFSLVAFIWGWSERRAIAEGRVSAENRIVLDLGFFIGLAGTVIGAVTYTSCFGM